MRIAILSPPLGSLTQAPLSLPSLTAFLRESGHEVAQHDLGIKCIDRMLTRDYLERLCGRINVRASHRRAPGGLSPKDKTRWRMAVTSARVAGDWTIAHIEEAKRVMRSPERFYRRDEYVGAKNAIRNALQMVTAAYFPLELIFNEIRYPFVASLDAILDMPPDRSPFTEPMRSAMTADSAGAAAFSRHFNYVLRPTGRRISTGRNDQEEEAGNTRRVRRSGRRRCRRRDTTARQGVRARGQLCLR